MGSRRFLQHKELVQTQALLQIHVFLILVLAWGFQTADFTFRH